MGRLIVVILFLLLSLLNVCKAPLYYLWYVAILVSEFPLIFIAANALLLVWGISAGRILTAANALCFIALLLSVVPVWGAVKLSATLSTKIDAAFGPGTSNLPGAAEATPFSFLTMLKGLTAQDYKETYQTINYSHAGAELLSLDFYPAEVKGLRPCIVVVHGGSWAAGDSRQLPDLNGRMAKMGYHVASINYRLAPASRFPAPLQDLQAALRYLRSRAASMSIDTTRFVLLGRSAGGQIVLSAAYTLKEPGIKGVIDFYGPADMVWGYEHPGNKLVLDTRQVMSDYLGGSYARAPAQYIASSAALTADSSAPPTLMIYGSNDALVNPEHGNLLAARLTALHTPHMLLSLPWATHGCDYSLNGPSGQLCTYTIDRFLYHVCR